MKKWGIIIVLLFQAGLVGCATFDRPKNPTTQEFIRNHDNAKPYEKYSYYLNSQGEEVKHGPYTEFWDNGSIKFQGNYVHGREEGAWLQWHDNGAKWREANYKEGKLDGPETWWDKSGHKTEAFYKGGRIQGNKTTRKSDQIVRVEYYGNDGKLDKIEGWNSDGSKAYEGEYKNGKQHGTWTYWHSDGRVKAQGEWYYGEPWDGICYVLAAGDAGSWGGLREFIEYREGSRVRRASLPEGPTTQETVRAQQLGR